MTLLIEETDGTEPFRIFTGLRDRRGLFFLDSALPAEGLSAYSILGFDPFLTFRARGREIILTDRGTETRIEADPLALLRARLAAHRCEPHPELPFIGGAVGYLSYEYGARWEITTKLTVAEMPDIEFGFYEGSLLYSHAKRRWFLVANGRDQESSRAILDRLREAFAGALASKAEESPAPFRVHAPISCEDKARYLNSVERIRAYIRSGDVYQVNLAQRFEAEWEGQPDELYRRLRRRSPAPFACFLTLSDGHLISSSPERFMRLRNGIVETRPIKGTRPRGATQEEEERLAADLIGSAKERAELLMIVDLERNDLGRVCVPGSIQVTDLYHLEKHPTVFHLVATVTGKLREECDALDLLRATFPGGSITGAPKIRAMQIIDELESFPRGVYTGSVGYLGFDGGCDLNIAIRTIIARGRHASYHVGAGVVWDSDPESEYEETLRERTRAVRSVVGIRRI